MSIQSADTARESGKVAHALLAAGPGILPPLPWPSDTRPHDGVANLHEDRVGEGTGGNSDTDFCRLLSHNSGSPGDTAENLDMCASVWTSVRNLARMLAASSSVRSTISNCYGIPTRCSKARKENDSFRARPELESSLVSDRLTTEALDVFRRYG